MKPAPLILTVGACLVLAVIAYQLPNQSTLRDAPLGDAQGTLQEAKDSSAKKESVKGVTKSASLSVNSSGEYIPEILNNDACLNLVRGKLPTFDIHGEKKVLELCLAGITASRGMGYKIKLDAYMGQNPDRILVYLSQEKAAEEGYCNFCETMWNTAHNYIMSKLGGRTVLLNWDQKLCYKYRSRFPIIDDGL